MLETNRKQMKNKPLFLLVALLLCFVTNSQTNVIIKTGIGIQGGVTQFNILTDNFDTSSGLGFVGGFSATGDIPHKWYNVSFGLQFFQNNLEISARETQSSDTTEMLDYQLQGVQGTFLFHIKIADNFFTLVVGPQIQFNSELELDNETQETFFINGYDNLNAGDISDITKLNANGVIGLSGGIGPIRLRVHYTYGFTNILNNLNDQDLNTSGGESRFNGNQSIISATALFTF